jgi:glutamate racemase
MFDSGTGGLSVRDAVARLLPRESIWYFADTAHCPYGERKPAEVAKFCDAITRFLLGHGPCKLVVLACNTATAMAVETLRREFPHTDFVGMEPAIKPAAGTSRTRTIGVLATAGTFHGRLYQETCLRHAQGTRIISVAGTGLVELVEAGRENSSECEALLRRHLKPMLEAGADCIVLGCTHYVFLEDAIRRVTGEKVGLLSSGDAVARRVRSLLETRGLLAPPSATPSHRYFTTGTPKNIEHRLRGTVVEPVRL